MRAHRFRHGAQVLEQLAPQAGQRKALGGARRKRQAPVRQGERLLVAVLARLLARRRQIGRRSTRVFGTIEVLGVQRQVALRKPCGRPPMQLAPPGLEQRVVYGIADQGVREQEPVARRAHEQALDQGGAAVARIVHEVAQRVQREALPEYRSRLDGQLVRRRQVVEARLHQALHRTGDGGLGRTLGVAQQLLQEQGIASRALDAPPGEVAVRLEVSLGERARLAARAAVRDRWSRADCRRCRRARRGRADRPRCARS